MTPDIRATAAEVIRLSETAPPAPWQGVDEEMTDAEGLYALFNEDGPEQRSWELIAFYRTAAPALAEALLAALERERELARTHYAFYESDAPEGSTEYRRLWDEYETARSAIFTATAREESGSE